MGFEDTTFNVRPCKHGMIQHACPECKCAGETSRQTRFEITVNETETISFKTKGSLIDVFCALINSGEWEKIEVTRDSGIKF